MPKQSGSESGFDWDSANSRLDVWYRGSRAGSLTGTSFTGVLGLSSGTTITATTGLTVTTGNSVNTAGDERITAGNLRLGAVETFVTTQPTSAIVMKAGTAPDGAVTTSGAIFTDGTTVKKMIAAGTVSDIQT